VQGAGCQAWCTGQGATYARATSPSDYAFVREAADWAIRPIVFDWNPASFSLAWPVQSCCRMASRPRIVIASPHVPETTLLADWITSEGFEPVSLTTLARAAEHIKDRPYDLVMADFLYAFREQQLVTLVRARNAKTPIVVIGDDDAGAEAQALTRGATYLARPLERASVVCTVSMAIMETRPVRRSVRKPVNRLDAVVGGVPSHIVDVSKEGLRLEIPRGRKSMPPPPHFTVRVPLLGVALNVRRMWTCNVPQSNKEATWYGGELTGNSRMADQAWRVLVDTIPTAGTAMEVY
jgi:AmiR/NasT family two-component response regulator